LALGHCFSCNNAEKPSPKRSFSFAPASYHGLASAFAAFKVLSLSRQLPVPAPFMLLSASVAIPRVSPAREA
jgi:hypothetical protein